MTGDFKTRYASELLEIAASTFSKNFCMKIMPAKYAQGAKPHVFVGDVAELEFGGMDSTDVLIGGPPCQDFSIVRGPSTERQGISVHRGKLYSHFVRALAFLQPRAFVFENVPGLLSANSGIAYDTIQDDIRHLDFRWAEIRGELGRSNNSREVKPYRLMFSEIVDMAKLGVPQARRRLIMIGLRTDLLASCQEDEVSEAQRKLHTALSGQNSLFAKFPLTPMEVFAGRVLPDLGEEYRLTMEAYSTLTSEVRTERARKWETDMWKHLTMDVVQDYLWLNKVGPFEADRAFDEHKRVLRELGYWGKGIQDVKSPDGTSEIPKDSYRILERMRFIPPGQNHEFVRGTKWEVEGRGMSLIYRRLCPLKPSYTVVAYGGGGTWGYHFRRDRATLSNRERARLQSFRDDFQFLGSRGQIRTQIGEAVPPLGAKRIATAVKELLDMVA